MGILHVFGSSISDKFGEERSLDQVDSFNGGVLNPFDGVIEDLAEANYSAFEQQQFGMNEDFVSGGKRRNNNFISVCVWKKI